ncbi:MAG: LD-carboxypeptidase [Bacteroidales bacterium]|nr:LD-carboxypeptidase [Bacteroidales bacterium]
MKIKHPIIIPKRLKKGDTIGLITPAGVITPEKLANTKKLLSDLGYKTFHTENVLRKRGYLAGSDKEKLDDLHLMFKNDEVNAIMCIRGGYGTMRLLPFIDYDLIRRHAKILIGYSDITALIQAIYKKTGLVGFHGVVGTSAFTEYTLQNFLDILTITSKTKTIHSFPPKPDSVVAYLPYVLNSGKAQGKLIGGNLALLASLMGTPYEPDFENKIVFIEDIDEAPYRIDRMLTQLLLSGKLQKAAGIVLGVFNACDLDRENLNPENSLSLKEVITDRLSDLDMPVMYGFSFGHIQNQAIFPVGVLAEMDTERFIIRLLEPAVL